MFTQFFVFENMENLKLVRKVKKMSNRQLQRERETHGSISARMPSYAQSSGDFYDQYMDYTGANTSQEGDGPKKYTTILI